MLNMRYTYRLIKVDRPDTCSAEQPVLPFLLPAEDLLLFSDTLTLLLFRGRMSTPVISSSGPGMICRWIFFVSACSLTWIIQEPSAMVTICTNLVRNLFFRYYRYGKNWKSVRRELSGWGKNCTSPDLAGGQFFIYCNSATNLPVESAVTLRASWDVGVTTELR